MAFYQTPAAFTAFLAKVSDDALAYNYLEEKQWFDGFVESAPDCIARGTVEPAWADEQIAYMRDRLNMVIAEEHNRVIICPKCKHAPATIRAISRHQPDPNRVPQTWIAYRCDTCEDWRNKPNATAETL